MGKVAHAFYGLPPSVSLNTHGLFGGLPWISAWNHRSLLLVAGGGIEPPTSGL